MALYSGSLSDYVSNGVIGPSNVESMAEAMDKALNALRSAAGQPALKQDKEATDRRMLFIAIAKGVIEHLVLKDATSLSVSVSGSGHTHSGSVTVTGN